MMEKWSNESDELRARFAAVEENYKQICDTIARAAQNSGRSPEEVTLLAATKTVPVEVINHAIHLGVRHIGENRVQELLEKYDGLDKENATLHFIGHLQTNKVRQLVGAVPRVKMIQSVDSAKLAAEISRLNQKHGANTDVLIEVNIGREENKSGIPPEALDELTDEIRRMKGLHVKGLMAIPPVCENKAELEKYFTQMHRLFIDIGQKTMDNVTMDYLSMGMSGDYELAVQCGSNMVRIGSALFGARIYR